MGGRGSGRRATRAATTLEGRETQLISLAFDLVERKISDGTASSQEVTHFLKLGSSRERLEQEKIKQENLLLAAKIESIASGQRIEELYGDAIAAMRTYTGQDDYDEG